MRFFVASLIAAATVLTGCASAEKVACAFGAFGAGVNGGPEPSCVREIQAREAAPQPPRSAQLAGLQEPEQGTTAITKQIDDKRLAVAIQRSVTSRLKEEPSLLADQVRWLVTIEDSLIEVDQMYQRAKITLFLSDKNVGDRLDDMRKLYFSEFVKTFIAATEAHDKATRDLGTISTRVEIQKQAGSGYQGSVRANPTDSKEKR